MDLAFLGPLSAFGASVTWAVGSAGYSKLSRGHSAFAVNFARALVAFPLFVITAMLFAGGPAPFIAQVIQVQPIQITWLAISIFASYGIGDVLFMWSTRSLGVPAALAIGSTYPILSAGYGVIVHGDTLSSLQLLGLLMTVAGVVTVILSGAAPTPASSEGAHAAPAHLTKRSLGIALAFGTMAMWALNSIATARVGQTMNPLMLNSFRMAFALAMSWGFSRVLVPKTDILLPARVIRGVLPILFFEAFGGSLLYAYGLSNSTLALGSTLTSLAPVLSVPVAWALGLEKFSVSRTMGICCVVLGLALLVGLF